jgi:hypothetical protein
VCGSSRQRLPPLLSALVDRLIAAGVYCKAERPNHCLVNDYADGAGIAAHTDGPLYVDRVATITLAGSAVIALHRPLPDGSAGELVAEVWAPKKHEGSAEWARVLEDNVDVFGLVLRSSALLPLKLPLCKMVEGPVFIQGSLVSRATTAWLCRSCFGRVASL